MVQPMRETLRLSLQQQSHIENTSQSLHLAGVCPKELRAGSTTGLRTMSRSQQPHSPSVPQRKDGSPQHRLHVQSKMVHPSKGKDLRQTPHSLTQSSRVGHTQRLSTERWLSNRGCERGASEELCMMKEWAACVTTFRTAKVGELGLHTFSPFRIPTVVEATEHLTFHPCPSSCNRSEGGHLG